MISNESQCAYSITASTLKGDKVWGAFEVIVEALFIKSASGKLGKTLKL